KRRRNEAANFSKNNKQRGTGKDAKPAAPFELFGENGVVAVDVHAERGAGNQQSEENQENAERHRKKAGPHLAQRADVVILAFDCGNQAEEDHQPAGVIILFYLEHMTQSGGSSPAAFCTLDIRKGTGQYLKDRATEQKPWRENGIMAGWGRLAVKVRNPQNFYGGLALVGLAVIALIATAELAGIEEARFGAGTAPRMFAVLLAFAGGGIALA